MAEDFENFLAIQRGTFRDRPLPRRLAVFLPSQRCMRIDDFDATQGPWPVVGCHRKFRSALSAQAVATDPDTMPIVLFDFALTASGDFLARSMLPIRFDADTNLLHADGPARSNPQATDTCTGEAPPSDRGRKGSSFSPDREGYAILIAAAVDPLATSLDVARHPCILDNPLLRRLAGFPTSECGSPRAWDGAEINETLPLDPDQAAAVADAVEGHNLCVYGPPGCGKSQVIAALLAVAPSHFRICVSSTEASALAMIRRRMGACPSRAAVVIASPAEVAVGSNPEAPFDLLIVDEAARMPFAVGLGLAARARQVVAVGDPLQLGPRDGSASLLDRAVACGMKARMLPWHYRSSTGSLIAPMNLLVYHQRLRAVPAPTIAGVSGLRLFEHRGAVVVRDDGRWVVETEADAVVSALEDHARSGDSRSLAVVSLRPAQTDYVKGRIRAALAEGRFTLADLNRTPHEPFFVATATDVQGEERDRIIVSFGLARRGDPVVKRFGCLEGSQPMHLLNVALTRARDACDLHVSVAVGDVERSPLSPAGAAFSFTLKAARLFTQVDSLLEVDPGLDRYAKRRGLEVRHLGVVQGLFRPGDVRFRAGVVKHEAPHDAARWGAIGQLLTGKGWNVVEATETCLDRLQRPTPCALSERLDALTAASSG